MLAKFLQMLSTFLALTTAPITTALTVRHAAVLSAPTALHIERGLVPEQQAQTLYQEILEAAVPGPHDEFHGSLLGIMGDAGAQVVKQIPEERVTKFRQIIVNEQDPLRG